MSTRTLAKLLASIAIASWLAASGTASGLTSPAPSCTSVSRGATILLSNRDGQIFSRPSRYGTTFFYGCFNRQPRSRYLASSRYDDAGHHFVARGVSGGFAAYTTAEHLVEVMDLVHGRRIFVRPRPADTRSACIVSTTDVPDVRLNRYGRVGWFEVRTGHSRCSMRVSSPGSVFVHDRRGTVFVGSSSDPVGEADLCCLSLGIKSMSWRDEGQLQRALVF